MFAHEGGRGNVREKLAATIFQLDNGAGETNCGTFTHTTTKNTFNRSLLD